ncbi:hypothetical protein LCGC14_3011000, partial [marine sediment metagenome]
MGIDEDKEIRQIAYNLAMKTAHIPENLRSGFETYVAKTPEHATLITAAKSWADAFDPRNPPKRGLVFSGLTGCGKSHLAAAIMARIIKRTVFSYDMQFWRMDELFGDIRATWGKGAPAGSEKRLLEDLNQAQLLVLDDFGSERPVYHVLERLYTILGNRECVSKPIIVTTNLGPQRLEDYWKRDPECSEIAERV